MGSKMFLKRVKIYNQKAFWDKMETGGTFYLSYFNFQEFKSDYVRQLEVVIFEKIFCYYLT